MFRNLQIRSKLGAIVVVPLVALIVFASLQVGSSISQRTQANRSNRLTSLAVRLTALTDSLQQERATSTGYIASQTKSFRPDMMTNRAQVDRGAAALRQSLVDLDASEYSQRLQSDIADTTRRLDGLTAWRGTLDGNNLPVVARVESFYGELLQSLLTVISDIGNEPGSRSVKADIAALVEISRAKEAASQSTSLLFAALIAKQFGPGDYQRFASLVGEESSSVARFESIASPAQEVQFDHRVAGAANSSLGEVMRQAALAGPGKPPELNPKLWLDTMSQKIAAFHQVELRVASDVAAAATADRDSAVRQTVITSVIMLLVVLLAVGLSLLLARSMAQPLVALERSARDVARTHLPGVVERLQRPDARLDHADIEAMALSGGVPVRSRDEIGRLGEAFNTVNEVAIRTAAEQSALRNSIGAMFLNLARRSQRLVDRQLQLIDELEREEADPEALENLFKLDHLATRMRRNAEDLIVLSGAEPPRRWSEPVPLPQVVRGAVAEVEDYQRIELLPIDDVGMVGHAVADIIHMLAELLENATSFSPPGTTVRVAGQPAATGYVVEIEDRGLGMSDEELLDANQRLANPPVVDLAVSRMLGLFVVGRLAQRYGIRVQLRHSWYGGVTALVLVPSALLTWTGIPESQERPQGEESELESSPPELAPPAQDELLDTGAAMPVARPPAQSRSPRSSEPVGPPPRGAAQRGFSDEPLPQRSPRSYPGDRQGHSPLPTREPSRASSETQEPQPFSQSVPGPFQHPPRHLGQQAERPQPAGAAQAATAAQASPGAEARAPAEPAERPGAGERPVPGDRPGSGDWMGAGERPAGPGDRPEVSQPTAGPAGTNSDAFGDVEDREAEAGQAADRLPIFEQARSDWFDSPGGGPGYLPPRRYAQPPGADQPRQPRPGEPGAAGPGAPGRMGSPPPTLPTRQRPQQRPQQSPQQFPQPSPYQEQQPAASRQRPRTADDVTAVPLPQVGPGAFGPGGAPPRPMGAGPMGPPRPGPGGPGGPSGPGGPGAPPQFAGGPAGGPQRLTRTGLPRRVPRANLAPGISATPPPSPEQMRQPSQAASRAARSPDDVRSMLSSYRSGLERGRRMAAGPDTDQEEMDDQRGFGSAPMPPRSIDDPAE
jgi:signal transduction histidine kinase